MRGWRRLLVSVAASLIGLAIAASAASADTLTAMCTATGVSAPCSSTTWYSSTVTVVWTVDTPPDPNSSCNLESDYNYTGDAVQPISCSKTWSGDGTTVIKQYTLHIETSTPSVSYSLARPPDANGWYTHPVAVTFSGSSFSGIASCTPPTTYSGASISGTCTDQAGKVASTTVSLNYDAAPPAITGAVASRSPDYRGWYTKPVSFTFSGSDRGSGIDRCQVVKYSGPISGFVTGGCWDRAGNYGATTFPVAFLDVIGGASAARVRSAPVLLRWRPTRHATYYNVQLYRGHRKVLSRWPSRSSLFLSRSWRFNGRRFHLKPGRYRWYVWPGYGSRAADRYGRMIDSATFTVT